MEGSGVPLGAAMLGGSGDAAAEDEDDEELGERRPFDEPICALVQNCTVLHNIVGPACIFLRQSFAQAQLVCTSTYSTFLKTHKTDLPSLIVFLVHLQSFPIILSPFP